MTEWYGGNVYNKYDNKKEKWVKVELKDSVIKYQGFEIHTNKQYKIEYLDRRNSPTIATGYYGRTIKHLIDTGEIRRILHLTELDTKKSQGQFIPPSKILQEQWKKPTPKPQPKPTYKVVKLPNGTGVRIRPKSAWLQSYDYVVDTYYYNAVNQIPKLEDRRLYSITYIMKPSRGGGLPITTKYYGWTIKELWENGKIYGVMRITPLNDYLPAPKPKPVPKPASKPKPISAPKPMVTVQKNTGVKTVPQPKPAPAIVQKKTSTNVEPQNILTTNNQEQRKGLDVKKAGLTVVALAILYYVIKRR